MYWYVDNVLTAKQYEPSQPSNHIVHQNKSFKVGLKQFFGTYVGMQITIYYKLHEFCIIWVSSVPVVS